MKYFITVILVFSISLASAQIVNIPDPVFKQGLLFYPGLDANNNGEIEVSEALTVTDLQITSLPPYISDLTGLEAFQNVERFVLYSYNITNLDLGNMLPNVKILSINSNPTAESLDISGCTKLESFNCTSLGNGGVFTPPFFNLTVGHLTRLKVIGFVGITFGSLDFTGCDSLKRINTTMTIGPQFYAQSIDISGLQQIDTFYNFSINGSLLARNCTGLKSLRSYSPLDFNGPLDVTGCTNLRDVRLDNLGSGLTNLDFSSCTSLNSLNLGTTKNLQYLNIKNGLSQTVSVGNIYNNPPINVCVDDIELTPVLNAFLSPNLGDPFTANVSSNCSFFPGGNYNTTRGKVNLDLNNNGCDNNDPVAFDIPIRVSDNTGSLTTVYSSGGNYTFYSYAGIFNLAPYFPYPYFSVNPNNATVNFPAANSIIDTADFCISPVGTHNDLEITLLPLSSARPGFTGSYRLIYKNNGNTTMSGDTKLNFDISKMSFVEATEIPVQNSGQLSWNYSNLLPFESRSINISFNLLPPPVNNMGDTLIFLAMINPVANDETPYDNSFILPQLVRGPFDPNDKQCLEGNDLDISSINNYLHYIIRFQNLGNDTAFNVVVVDTLSNNLDWNTVEFIGSSHPCHAIQKNGRLEFFFENIQLPYKAVNETKSNGFTAFKIKPKNNLSLGDSLNNKAAIYFDFNPPVITNTATTILRSDPVIPVKLEYFSGSKQQNKNVLTWKAPSTNGITIFSIERSNDGVHFNNIGNITASVERCQLPFNFIDENSLPVKNFYRLKITDIDRITFYSKIVLLENDNKEIEILSVTGGNTVYINSSKQQSLQLKVVAMDGSMIYMNNKIITTGSNKIELPLNKLSKGVYTLIIYTNDGEMITKRFVK